MGWGERVGIVRRQYASRTPDSALLAAGEDERFLRPGFVTRSCTLTDRNETSVVVIRRHRLPLVVPSPVGVSDASVFAVCCRPDSVCIPVNARRVVAAGSTNE